MEKAKFFAVLIMSAMPTMAFAVDSACNPIISASEKKMQQASWHSTATLASGQRMESLKAEGGFFRNVAGSWMKSTVNFDIAERDMIAQIRSGAVKLTNCKSAGSDYVDGISVNVISSTIEMPGAPAADSKLYVGKNDGLPYKQSSKDLEVIFRYKNVSAPKT